MSANYELRGDVAVITMDNPPVNGLGHDTRARHRRRPRAGARPTPTVKAIVVTGAGKAFSGGADIREFGSPKALAEPNLLTLIAAFEASPKPIVAAIHSVAHGRRPRARARLPLPRRAAGRADRAARSEDRPASRAPAARSACRACSASRRRST